MRVTVFQAALVPESIRENFPNYGKMIADLIGDHHKHTYDVVSLLEDDPVPHIDEIEAMVISGSPFGVYDQIDWIDPLRELIRNAYERSIPTIGICFGHQLIADALGGRVEKSAKGWGLGRHTYEITNRPEFMIDGPDLQSFSVLHQDQVIEPPKTANVVGGNDFTPNAMLSYENGAAFSIQAHPEFEDQYTRELLHQRKGYAFTSLEGEAAIGQIDGNNHNQILGNYFRALLNVK